MADAPFVSLYRRFRPGQFEELRGQDHVVRALRSAVRDDRVSHAYLFSGPRGTGKTSSARILAKALNCEAPVDGEPCGVCTSCVEITQGSSLNVHELDAASNNGVDAMRDLVAHAGLGTPGRWKVYIVDEVHMLSTAAANALLKTLEEPPSHVVFVLATTDPQKVPPTIRSRTQHLEFRLLGAETLHDLLESVNEEAGLQVDEAVAGGCGTAWSGVGPRRALCVGPGRCLGLGRRRPTGAGGRDRHAGRGDVSQVLVALSALLAGGWGPQQLGTELIDDLRQVFLAALAPELCAVSGPSLQRFRAVAEAMGLARVVRSMEILGHALVDMREAPDAQVVLEIAAVRAVRPDLDSGMEALSERVSVLERSQSGAPAFPRPGATPHARGPGACGRRDGPAPGGTGGTGARARRRRWRAAVTRRGAAQQGGGCPHAGPRPTTPAPAPADTSPAAPPASPPPPPVPTSHARSRQPHRGLGRRHSAATAGAGQGALRQRSLRGGGRPGGHFALPNAAHREQCAETQPVVEAALSDHFGTRSPWCSMSTTPGHRRQRVPARPPRRPAAKAGAPRRRRLPRRTRPSTWTPAELIDDTSRPGLGRRGAPPARLPGGERGARVDVHRLTPLPHRRARPPAGHRAQVRSAHRLSHPEGAERGGPPVGRGRHCGQGPHDAVRRLLQRGGVR